MSYTLTFTGDFGPESTGATMRCQLFTSAGAASGGALSGVVELGTTGVFQYTATLADGFRGSLVMYELADPTNRAGFGINPEEAENTDVKTSAIKAKTDNLPNDPADASDIAAALATVGGYVDTEVAAIKAKTDNLPAQPAAVGDIPTVVQIDTQLTATHGAGSWANALGSPAGIIFTYTVTSSSGGAAIPDVAVWFATDSAIANVVWYGITDAFGIARDHNGNKPRLDAGTYYILLRKTGYTFAIDTETVS